MVGVTYYTGSNNNTTGLILMNFLQTSMNARIRSSTNVMQKLHVKILRVLTRVNVRPDQWCLLIIGHVMVSYVLPVKHFIARRHSYLVLTKILTFRSFGNNSMVTLVAWRSCFSRLTIVVYKAAKICRFEWLSYWANAMFTFSSLLLIQAPLKCHEGVCLCCCFA